MDIFHDLFEEKDEKNNFSGIVTGIVKEIYNKSFPGMIKAEIFMTDGTVNVTDWMRIVVPYGGKDKGMYFLPDIGDEVVIAFERGDIARPFVLGVLWNNVDTIPKDSVDEKNNIKKIKTRGGHEIIFDDTEKKEKINIITPKKSTISIDDEKSTITITAKGDNGDNKLELDSKNGNITISAKKKLVLDAADSKAQIIMDGQSKSIKINCDNINLDGKSIKVKGNNISINGSTTDINASGSLNVKSKGAANIKGSIVKIN